MISLSNILFDPAVLTLLRKQNTPSTETSKYSGYSGYSDYSGYSGYSGYSDYSGYNGYNGYSSNAQSSSSSTATTTATVSINALMTIYQKVLDLPCVVAHLVETSRLNEVCDLLLTNAERTIYLGTYKEKKILNIIMMIMSMIDLNLKRSMIADWIFFINC